jgi:hypothetical protein
MEQLLHYVWKHKLFPLAELRTTSGQLVEVVNPGMPNSNAGPDFFNAEVRIDGVAWVGNVEIHDHSSSWYRHLHATDPAYSNVILHVVGKADCAVAYPDGTHIPQIELPVPDYVLDNYDELVRSDSMPRCKHILPHIPKLTIHSWMSALQVERLEQRTNQIMARREACDKDWEHTLFVTIARNFGFGVNGDAFERWAHSVPLNAVAKHRDSLFQIEAIFFGQAGLLEPSFIPSVYADNAQHDEYLQKLRAEYRYLQHKFSISPMDSSVWRFMRMRPQNFPHIRIAQLAMLYYEQRLNLSRLVNAESLPDVCGLLRTNVSDYWRTHYTFASNPSAENDKNLSVSSLNLIILNSVVPMLFAYGRYKAEEHLCERAFSFMESLRPESNHIVRSWESAGIRCESAADSQALIQLTRNYCEPHDCLRCRFGGEFIRRTPGFLREDE